MLGCLPIHRKSSRLPGQGDEGMRVTTMFRGMSMEFSRGEQEEDK